MPLLVALVAALGCGDGGLRAPSDPLAFGLAKAPPVPVEGFCAAYLGARCEREVDCERYGQVPSPFDDCQAWVAAMLPGCEAAWAATPGAGLAVYSAATGGRCVERMRLSECVDVFAEDAMALPCVREAFEGLGAEGRPCHGDLTCANGLVCDASAACPGVCVVAAPTPSKVPAGGACGDGVGRCAFGLLCPSGVCVDPQPLGAACGEEDGPCDEYRHWCEPSPEGPSVCAPLPGPGADCGLGLSPRCSRATCDPGFGACFQPKRAAGEPCAASAPEVCESWSCGEAGLCDPVAWPEEPCPLPTGGA